MVEGGADRVVSWNAKISRPPNQVMNDLADLLRNTQPDVACLQECTQYTDEIRTRFKDHWFVYAQKTWHESNESPVLVRRDNHVRRRRGEKTGWGVVDTKVRWVGPEGGTHDGRTWTWVYVGGIWVMSLHRATDGDGQNKKACIEEYDRLVKWIGNHQPCLVIGDHNMSARADFPGASSRVARDSGSTLSFESGSGLVDYGIQNGVRGDLSQRHQFGSDHHAVLWVAK